MKAGKKTRSAAKKARAGRPHAARPPAPRPLSPEETQLQNQAAQVMRRMNTTAASVIAYRDAPGDYGDMSEQNQEEWLFVNRNHANSQELKLIEEALQRIKDGTYGICAQCGKKISAQRLRAVPWAQNCIDCQDRG